MSKLTNIQVEEFLNKAGKTNEIKFLEEGKEKNDLIESAKKRGILIEGSRDLGIIKTIFLFTDRPNSNKAIVPSKEFQKKFPQIVGKPMNVNHIRDLIVGYYIDYKYILSENKAIAYSVFFKSIYPDLWEKAKLFKSRKKLSSSFEIWSPEDKRKYFKDGTYELHQMEMAGGALIFEERGNEPAFKDAKVLKIAKKDIASYVVEECLVCASKYQEGEIIMAENYFMKNVKENIKKLQEEKKAKEQPKKEEPKVEVKAEEPKKEVKVEPKPEERVEPQTSKIKCSNCGEEMDYNGIDVKIKCSKCFAILNKEGVMQYPPQIRDFRVLCPSCKVTNWLILSKTEEGAKLRCESCSKEYKIDFVQTNINTKELLDKFNFVYTGSATCPQCHKQIAISGISNLTNRTLKCPKCKVEFAFNISHETYRKISKIEEIKIDKIEKSAKTEKGGKEMDCKLELSKFHRYVDVEKFEDFEKSLPKDYDESKEIAIKKTARLTREQRNALPDSNFAVVVRVKNKRTGKTRKVRMFLIHDKDHVKNALAMLEQSDSQATLKRLGVSIETVRAKMIKLLEHYKKATKIEPKKVVVKKEKPKVEVKKAEKKIDEKKVDKKVEEAKKEKADAEKAEAKKKDLALYTLENKLAKYVEGIRKLAARIRSNRKELETVKAGSEEKVKFYRENAKKIYNRREELGDFAKDLSDEDINNDDKFEKAQLKKQVAEATPPETASETVGDKGKNRDEYTGYRKQIDANAFPKPKGQK